MIKTAVSTGSLWQYSLLAIPIAFAGFPLYVLAPDYYATTHGVSLSLLGFLLLVLRLFDAVQDPIIGIYCDRYRHLSARFMGMAAIILCAGIYGLFNLLPLNAALWFSICIAITITAYSVLSINLNALGGLWAKDSTDQTRIASWREAFGLMGLVAAVSLPSFFKHYMSESHAYLLFSITLTILMLCTYLLFRNWLSNHTEQDRPAYQSHYSLSTGIKSISGETWGLFAVYGLSMLASAIPAVLVIFFVRDLLGAESLTGVFLLLYFLSGAVSMPIWKFVSQKLGTYQAWIWAMLLAVGSFVWAFFLGSGDIWQYAIICAVSGLALGADLAIPPSLLAGYIQRHKAEEYAATHYSLLALIAKLSLALASAIALPALSIADFTPGARNAESSLSALSILYALVPCALKLLSAALLARMFIYPLQGVTYENSQSHLHFRSSRHV